MKYEKPEVILVLAEDEDIITTSYLNGIDASTGEKVGF